MVRKVKWLQSFIHNSVYFWEIWNAAFYVQCSSMHQHSPGKLFMTSEFLFLNQKLNVSICEMLCIQNGCECPRGLSWNGSIRWGLFLFPSVTALCAVLFPIQRIIFLMDFHSAVASQWLLCCFHKGSSIPLCRISKQTLATTMSK